MEQNYAEIVERMRWGNHLKNDSALARKLGVTPQAMSNYKKRGSIPPSLVIKLSRLTGLSVDWLLTGEGKMYLDGVTPPENMPVDLSAPAAHASAGLQLSPDEGILVGKVLKVARDEDPSKVATLSHMVDAFLRPTIKADLRAAMSSVSAGVGA